LKCFFIKEEYKKNKKNKKTTIQQKMEQNIKFKTHRYDFSKEIEYKLREFAKTHENSERKQTKQEWIKWMEKHEQSIKEEESRLKKCGYEGDVKTKMFTSIKYYYMKKNKKEKKEKKEKPEKRKKYISLSHSILETIDNHIMKEINHNMEKNGVLINIEPSAAYLNFCKENQTEIVEEIKILKEQMDQNEIATKLKKTYKNRYQNKKLALQKQL
jgi:hypothetical protein